MTFKNLTRNRSSWKKQLRVWVNLREGEGERTFVMLTFYTITSVGLLWLEQTTIALFLEGFGAEGLPAIYIASALMGSGLGFLYSWLQNHLPLTKVFTIISILMALPLLLFRVGLEVQYLSGAIALATVFLLRLWIDAEEILNDLNSQVAANQLFNIREIKRTYPIISSGLLFGDVISGFSLYLLVPLIGLKNIIILAALMISLGGMALLYLTKRYNYVFPDTPVKDVEELESNFTNRRLNSSLWRYVIPLFSFFILGEVLFLVLEFQYLGELEQAYPDTAAIAGFLGIFSGILGICEIFTQWFVSNRALERLGVFTPAMLLPICLSVLALVTIFFDITDFGIINLNSLQILFFGAIILKFIDDLLRYTLIAGIEPILFQPIPEEMRGSIQSWVQGIAEPLADGCTGLGILGVMWLLNKALPDSISGSLPEIQGGIFLGAIVFFSLCWAISALLLRNGYVNLLVQGAQQGHLGFANVDLKAFKRKVMETLAQTATEEDKRSCIQLLEQIDPASVGEIMSPHLSSLSPVLQKQSLKAMLKYPNHAYLEDVKKLIEQPITLEVLALALRYIWLVQPKLGTKSLYPYLNPEIDAVVRGTTAGLIMSRGTPNQKQKAIQVLEKMLTNPQERERMVATQALPELRDKQLARYYIPQLLEDQSARVRCAVFEVIGRQQLREFYPSLIKGLYYKSTREAAQQTLVSLGNETLSLLAQLSADPYKSEFIRLQAWHSLAAIGTKETWDTLVEQLALSWGTKRRYLLRTLLKIPADMGIEVVLEHFGRHGITAMIDQELLLLGHIYAAIVDLSVDELPTQEGELLHSALLDLQGDIIERCFLLLKFLYPVKAIQAAILNLRSHSQKSIAQGLEILDNVLDIEQKPLLIGILENKSPAKKLSDLSQLFAYHPLTVRHRLHHLLELRYFLSDWALACCFHLTRQAHWQVSTPAIITCLRHPSSFVREAVLAYLKVASPRICREILPVLKQDSNPLVAAQVEQISMHLSLSNSQG